VLGNRLEGHEMAQFDPEKKIRFHNGLHSNVDLC
jgi:hypothetical protein